MKIVQAVIERTHFINATYQHLEIATSEAAFHQIKPGQSILARPGDWNAETHDWHPYLSEHWWVVGIKPNKNLVVERPRTSTYMPNSSVTLLGPIGQPYRFRPSLRNVLLIAYNTEPTPLTIMTTLLLANNISTTLVLLGTARKYDTSHLPHEIEIIRGDDNFDWPDQVMTLGWADQVFVVAGQDDEALRFSEVMKLMESRRNDMPKQYVWGIFQPALPCGIGACTACALRVKSGLKFVCVDGPSFDLTTVKLPE